MEETYSMVISTTTTTEAPPGLITKKWLCARFGLIRQDGSVYYHGLYSKVLTPEVIEQMGCTIEQIRDTRLRTFNRVQTLKLIEILGL